MSDQKFTIKSEEAKLCFPKVSLFIICSVLIEPLAVYYMSNAQYWEQIKSLMRIEINIFVGIFVFY